MWLYPTQWYIWSFLLSLGLLVVYVKPTASRWFLGTVFITTFILTLLLFSPRTMGSLWCFRTAVLAPFLVMINYYCIRDSDTVSD